MSTANAYGPKEIISYERVVLKTLKWKINYPTLAFWGNYVTHRWDDYAGLFVTHFAYDIDSSSLKLPTFRGRNNENYVFFRNVFQVLDSITMDIEYLNFSDKFLVLAVIYLFLGVYLRFYSIDDIVNEFTRDLHCYTNFYELNIIFNRFLNNYIVCEFDEIVEHIFYVSQFFVIEFDYTPVMPAHEEPEDQSLVSNPDI
jgi:hypothetical protein